MKPGTDSSASYGKHDAVLYCDGASSGNPGRAGIGVVLAFGGRTYEVAEPIGIATNNIAEYTALIKGLSQARALGVENLCVFLDSELLVRQVEGIYKVKNEKLKEKHAEVMSQLRSFKQYSIRHIPREQNKRADALAKKAIKAAGGADPSPGQAMG